MTPTALPRTPREDRRLRCAARRLSTPPPLRSLVLLFRDAPRPRLYAARVAFYLGNFLIDDTAAHGPGLSMRPSRGHTGTGNGSVLRAPRADPERGSVVGSAGATLLKNYS